MIDLGKYRETIPSLKSLDIKDYERIFKIFKQSKDDKEFYTYNILNTLDFPKIDGIYLDHYTPPSKMAWTIISYNIYKDIKSWWILYLLNKDKFDHIPFVVDGGTQLKYIKDEYRAEIYNDITNSTTNENQHY